MFVLPTYGRPGRCQAALDSIAVAGPSEGIVWIDGDLDSAYDALVVPDGWSIHWPVTNLGFCGVLNAAFAMYPGEPWYGVISDDSLVRTPGWQAALVKQAGVAGFANSGDAWQASRRMHGAVVFGGDLLRAFGYWAPPKLQHSFVDDAWERLARALDNWRHVPQVLVEHAHRGNGKAEDDPTYQKAYSTFDDDKRAFQFWLRDEMPHAVNRAIPLVDHGDPTRARKIRARSKRVMIGTPVARAPALAYTLALVETTLLLHDEGIDCARHFVVGSSNLPAARNQICAAFLASSCTDLIMIDDDMGWQGSSIIRLLASDKPVAAIVARKKCPSPNADPSVWAGAAHLLDDGTGIIQDDMGFMRFDLAGTALIKIARSAFETIIAAHPEWKATGKPDWTEAIRANYYRFFRFGQNEYETGEDFEFCNSWTALGGEIWVDPEQKISHIGEHDYSGAFAEMMTAAAPEATT